MQERSVNNIADEELQNTIRQSEFNQTLDSDGQGTMAQLRFSNGSRNLPERVPIELIANADLNIGGQEIENPLMETDVLQGQRSADNTKLIPPSSHTVVHPPHDDVGRSTVSSLM